MAVLTQEGQGGQQLVVPDVGGNINQTGHWSPKCGEARPLSGRLQIMRGQLIASTNRHNGANITKYCVQSLG